MDPGVDGDYVTPVPPRPPGGSSRAKWLGVLAGFAVLVGVVVLQRHTGNAPTAGPTPITTPPTAASTGPSTVPSTARPEPPSTWTDTAMTSFAETRASTAAAPPTPSNVGLASTVATLESGVVPATSTGWDIVAMGWVAIGRLDPVSGRAVVVPTISSASGVVPQSMVSVPGRTFLGGATAGVIVPDDGPAVEASGALRDAWQVLPGPSSDLLWVVPSQPPNGDSVMQVDWTGVPTAAISLPPYLTAYGADIRPDGAGYLLARGVGGYYDVRPGSTRLITHGEILATGPSGYLAYECDNPPTCRTVLIDRTTQGRRVVPMAAPTHLILGSAGSITADERYAVLVETSVVDSVADSHLAIIDLRDGTTKVLTEPLSQRVIFSANAFGLSADGAYAAFPTRSDGIGIVELATGDVRHLDLPAAFPPIMGLATRVTG